MPNDIEDVTRRRVAKFLPSAIRKTLESYREFSQNKQDLESAKTFSAHHTACKVAIAHLELLLKLARWADASQDTSKAGEGELHAIMSEAMAEVDKHHKYKKKEKN